MARMKNTSIKIASFLDAINEATGRCVAWLTLAMVLVTFFVVLLRYGFSSGSIALQESITYMHAFVFMLGAAYTLKHDGHVRVDIIYQRLTLRGRAWIDLLGSLLLLLPFSIFILCISLDYAHNAWLLKEGSRETGGLPFLYILKAIIPATALLLMLQGCANTLRHSVFLFYSHPEQRDGKH